MTFFDLTLVDQSHHNEALRNKLIKILIFIPLSLEMMLFVLD